MSTNPSQHGQPHTPKEKKKSVSFKGKMKASVAIAEKVKEEVQQLTTSEANAGSELVHDATHVLRTEGDELLAHISARYYTKPKREILHNAWDVCCKEVAQNRHEVDKVLKRYGLKTTTFKKNIEFPYRTYMEEPELLTCPAVEFVDYFIFPSLLPGIQQLIDYVTDKSILTCSKCEFNPLDYLVEFLYNNNPFHLERSQNPQHLSDIPFAKDLLEKHPRKGLPKTLYMTSDEAARLIQRNVRGWFARKRQDVQELRQFWIEYRKDIEEEREKHSGLELMPSDDYGEADFE